ncbi:hypothetical protein [Virgibacillus phasianinus]|uniref:hypothetical protein n=1 Tax=Virgibacillus phasianinus TaxID=2017483 RepID=UPI0012FD80CD|nr:hypothetical protein [Virgibacillus phasianinus]
MTILGWVFWGTIVFIILLAVVLRRFGVRPEEKSENQIRAEEHARNLSNRNFTDGGGF